MKSFKNYLIEASKQPSDKEFRLSHLGKLSDAEQSHVNDRIDVYVDKHNMSGVAAENKVALEIKNMRKSAK
jgi:hypothetical protein